MRRLTLLLLSPLLATGCLVQDYDLAEGTALCAETASDLAPAQDVALQELATAQWHSDLLWADGDAPVGVSLRLAVAAEDGALIERVLVSDAGWAAPEDCESTVEASARAHLWTSDGRIDAHFSGDLVLEEDGRARFTGPEQSGVRYLAVTFEGDEMSGMLLPPEDAFSDEADPDGVSAPAASWPAE